MEGGEDVEDVSLRCAEVDGDFAADGAGDGAAFAKVKGDLSHWRDRFPDWDEFVLEKFDDTAVGERHGSR